MTTHPFLAPDFAVRWSQLVPAAVGPDITEALARAQRNLDAIAVQDSATVTFARRSRRWSARATSSAARGASSVT